MIDKNNYFGNKYIATEFKYFLLIIKIFHIFFYENL